MYTLKFLTGYTFKNIKLLKIIVIKTNLFISMN